MRAELIEGVTVPRVAACRNAVAVHPGDALERGVGPYLPRQLAEIMEAHSVAQRYHLIGPTMEQPQYNMFERFKMEQDYLPVFRSVGMGTTIWSPLAAGFLSGKYLDGIPKDSRFSMPGYEWLVKRWLQEDRIEKTKKLAALVKPKVTPLKKLPIRLTR